MKLFNLTPKKNKLHTVELSLMVTLFLAISATAFLNQEQENLAVGLIRLHVVANSNSDYDQDLKYIVRDAVLAQAEKLYQGGITPQEAENLFQTHLKTFQSVGETVSEGFPITAEITDIWFPTKEYDTFALPSGEYKALKITIGEGNGENWWCVAYPPLCLGAASETVEMAVEAGNFSQKESDLITGNGYILKFKSLELLGNVKQYFQEK